MMWFSIVNNLRERKHLPKSIRFLVIRIIFVLMRIKTDIRVSKLPESTDNLAASSPVVKKFSSNGIHGKLIMILDSNQIV